MFSGSIVALVTPMHADGSLDKKALVELIEWHIDAKTAGISAAGTTGEAPALDADEQFELLSLIVKQVKGRVPVLAGAGASSTRYTLKLAENAKRAGADGILTVTPYCNRPTQQGLYLHYKTLAEKIAMPLILYNVPVRTACDLLPETVEALAKIPHIIGIKEATGEVKRAEEIIARCPKDFLIYSGDDASGLSLLNLGARGVISVTANVAPQLMQSMCEAALAGDKALAEKLDQKLRPLHQHLFLQSNPIPTKWALQLMGKIQPYLRLPLVPLENNYQTQVKEAMQFAGAI